MSNFKALFMDFDRKLNAKLGDDVSVLVPGGVPVLIKGVIRLQIEDESLLDRFEEDIVTLEVLEDDLALFYEDVIVSFEGVDYLYVSDVPKGVGRHNIILREVLS